MSFYQALLITWRCCKVCREQKLHEKLAITPNFRTGDENTHAYTHAHTRIYIYIHTHTHIYICIYISTNYNELYSICISFYHLYQSTSSPIIKMSVPDMLLDPQLKYWVLLPITLAMVLVGLLRSNITYLLQPQPKTEGFRKLRESYVPYPPLYSPLTWTTLALDSFKHSPVH
ncbi:conserved hypothetical protein [Lodderomyces elongisporus NRRL YB-4239]|uniref:Uncharacterized protein n=1 Tax=Lodderomyces elongisporus (strain ATCC 11503 / CBS 2605 / JCM 1781 / NBRC 1676 / NRRL YB-4239) TaxID=379508 RepID=A5E778_LODEL|nr:conserved hypothetical protein [Lodderomyces elongisporus NRRL YB-4239]